MLSKAGLNAAVLTALAAALAQAESETAAPLHFEAASLKVAADQNIVENRPKRSVGRLRWNPDLLRMISYAYQMESWRISDTPGLQTIYTLDATTRPDTTQDQVRLMLQTLLAERLHLQTHRVTRHISEGYSITAGKGGPKLTPSQPAKPEAESGEFDDGFVIGRAPTADTTVLRGHNASMLQLAEYLQRSLDTSVVDHTNLTGRYDFELTCAREGPRDSPELLASCVKKAGLAMKKYKGPVEFLVIDHLGPLVEN